MRRKKIQNFPDRGIIRSYGEALSLGQGDTAWLEKGFLTMHQADPAGLTKDHFGFFFEKFAGLVKTVLIISWGDDSYSKMIDFFFFRI